MSEQYLSPEEKYPSPKFKTSQEIRILDEEYFEHEDNIAWYPGTSEQFSLQNVMLVLFMAKLMKTGEGQARLERIITKYLEVTGRIVESVADSSKTNWLNGINNVEFLAAITHKIGLIDNGGYVRMLNSVRTRFDKIYSAEAALSALGGVTTLIQGSKIETKTTSPTTSITTERGLATLSHLKSLLENLGK